ncbi:interleukin-8-like [Elgaria multicarinata webbii]|uniref:interleukin-8-like n=1 Tax=Elgaria multicarinata webbii TaxID=159646 RepID=UPI002FCCEECB
MGGVLSWASATSPRAAALPRGGLARRAAHALGPDKTLSEAARRSERARADARNMSPRRVVALLALLLAGSALLSQGVPLTGELRCQCIKKKFVKIPQKLVASVKFIYEGPHCAVSEVIGTLKNKSVVCLDPTTKWLNMFLKNELLKSRNTRRL